MAGTNGASGKLGVAALVAGVFSLFGSVMIYLTSALQGFNPPDWLRPPVMALFPLGFVVSLLLGAVALRGKGRSAAVAGWVASLAAMGLFVYALSTLG